MNLIQPTLQNGVVQIVEADTIEMNKIEIHKEVQKKHQKRDWKGQ